jgi:hypothetical protein
MTDRVVFYSRCKPQGADAIEIALAEKRVFFGHLMARAGAAYNPRNLKLCVVDPSCGDDEWIIAHAASDRRRQFNQNRNLVRKVVNGSIALIPRPTHGVIYCGRVVSKFELVNAPPWYDRYMAIRGCFSSRTQTKLGRKPVDPEMAEWMVWARRATAVLPAYCSASGSIGASNHSPSKPHGRVMGYR